MSLVLALPHVGGVGRNECAYLYRVVDIWHYIVLNIFKHCLSFSCISCMQLVNVFSSVMIVIILITYLLVAVY